ncbi:MAG TPA: YwiC-like family protein [Planctomycetota bacterium]|nr:YwiC-like family protein [Planctomycetota bacterium]
MSRRLWIPREHGAWAMLLAAIALAWALPEVRGVPAAVLTILFLLGFAIQEPLRVIVGGRGGLTAILWALAYAIPLLGGAAWLVATYDVYLLVPLAAAGILLTATDLALRKRGRHRNFLVRLIGGACLTLVLPATVAVAHKGMVSYAFAGWGLTLGYFVTRFISVRARNEARWRGHAADAWRALVLASQASLYVVLLPFLAAGMASAWLLVAFVPGSIDALRPHPAQSIRTTGWIEVPHLAWFVLAVIGAYHLR